MIKTKERVSSRQQTNLVERGRSIGSSRIVEHRHAAEFDTRSGFCVQSPAPYMSHTRGRVPIISADALVAVESLLPPKAGTLGSMDAFPRARSTASCVVMLAGLALAERTRRAYEATPPSAMWMRAPSVLSRLCAAAFSLSRRARSLGLSRASASCRRLLRSACRTARLD